MFRKIHFLKVSALFVVIALFFAAGPANAAEVFCKGKVEGAFVAKFGGVYVALASDWPTSNPYVRLCDLDEEYNTVAPDTCKGWLTILQSAALADADVLIKWNSTAVPSCSSLQNGSVTPAPEYVKFY